MNRLVCSTKWFTAICYSSSYFPIVANEFFTEKSFLPHCKIRGIVRPSFYPLLSITVSVYRSVYHYIYCSAILSIMSVYY